MKNQINNKKQVRKINKEFRKLKKSGRKSSKRYIEKMAYWLFLEN